MINSKEEVKTEGGMEGGKEEKQERSLADDIKKLLDTKALSDFTIEFNGGKKLAVHKCILAAR